MAEENVLNGLRVDKINSILNSMRDDKEFLGAVTGPWKSRVVWQGGFKAKAYMRKHAVKIHDLEIALEGNFENILKWAGHSQSGNPGYPSIKAKCFVRADADEKILREIWQAAVDGSPVTQTVARPTKIVTEFEKV
jgi:hypothetical protein